MDDETPEKHHVGEGDYANIRDVDQLGALIGCVLIDVTQHDKSEFDETGACYVALHFNNGTTVTFPVTDAGFDIEEL